MSSSMRAPSLELLRILRHSSSPSRCMRSKATMCLPRTTTASARSFSATRFRPAGEPSTTRAGTVGTSQAGSSSPPMASSTPSIRRNPYAPTTMDRGPASEEDTQTDFGAMDIYSNTPEPATSIDACTPGGFHLNNGTKITGGSGVLLAGGEAWSWKPWISLTTPSTQPRISDLLDPRRGTLVIPPASLAVLKFLHPKPDLLLVGTGSRTLMLHPDSRRYIVEELGLRVDVMDTANASAAYNLLATERGVEGGGGVGGAMLPVGWKGVAVKK